MTSDLPAGDVIVLHDDNGRHAYHALTLAMVALDALPTDQSSRALGCAQGARYGCPKAAASSLEQIVSSKAPFFTHPKEIRHAKLRQIATPGATRSEPEAGHWKVKRDRCRPPTIHGDHPRPAVVTQQPEGTS